MPKTLFVDRSRSYILACVILAMGSVTATAQNLVANPGFENGTTGWQNTNSGWVIDNSVFHSGKCSITTKSFVEF